MFTSIFTYMGDLKKAFDEEGMSGVFSKLKDDSKFFSAISSAIFSNSDKLSLYSSSTQKNY